MIDIREHGGAYGAGKYRKNKIITEDEIQILATRGVTDRTVSGETITYVSAGQRVFKGSDGYIYIIGTWLYSSNNYGLRITKATEELGVISSVNIPFTTVPIGGVLPAIKDGFIIGMDAFLLLDSYGLIKFNLSTNTVTWRVASSGVHYPVSLELMANGNILVGWYGNTVEKCAQVISPAGGVVLTIPAIGSYDTYVTADGSNNIYVASMYHSYGSTQYMSAAKFNSTGTRLWAMANNQFSYGLRGLRYNRVLNRLYTTHGLNLIELNKDTGAIVKSVNAAPLRAPEYANVRVDPAGRIFIACQDPLTPNGTTYTSLRCYDGNLNLIWTGVFDGKGGIVWHTEFVGDNAYVSVDNAVFRMPTKSKYKLL